MLVAGRIIQLAPLSAERFCHIRLYSDVIRRVYPICFNITAQARQTNPTTKAKYCSPLTQPMDILLTNGQFAMGAVRIEVNTGLRLSVHGIAPSSTPAQTMDSPNAETAILMRRLPSLSCSLPRR